MENTKEMIINRRGTRMIKDGEDWHGLQMTNLKHLDLTLTCLEHMSSQYSSNREY